MLAYKLLLHLLIHFLIQTDRQTDRQIWFDLQKIEDHLS